MADPDDDHGNDRATRGVKPEGGPEHTDADDERPASFGGDDDLAAGHLDELGDEQR